MAVVGDTAGVERKEERRSRRSSHPCVWPVSGACTKPDSRSADWKWKAEENRSTKNLKQTACVSFFLVAGHGESHSGQGREERRKSFQCPPP